VLLKTPLEKIQAIAAHSLGSEQGEKVADGIKRVRGGTIVIDPGYDGEYGKVAIWPEGEEVQVHGEKEDVDQLSLV
jgi:PHP family Zn ribbon phosphoesterase